MTSDHAALVSIPAPEAIVQVPIRRLLPADSPRLNGADMNHVRILAEYDGALPPILVHRQTMRVIDGMHRLQVAQLREQANIDVRFFDGSVEDAFVIAVEANRAHGLPLTLADREAAAARIIRTHASYSDRSIGTVTGLAASTVADIRRRIGDGSDIAGSRVGRDGRVRPLDGASGRLLASELITERPTASLREIARHAGISLATAHDVRERMRQGIDPLPPKQRGRRGEPTELRQAGRRGRDHRAQVVSPEKRNSLLASLTRDPSLRFTNTGRVFLRWLFVHAKGPHEWESVVDAIPLHSTHLVIEVARACAQEWSEFAAQLEQRLLT